MGDVLRGPFQQETVADFLRRRGPSSLEEIASRFGWTIAVAGAVVQGLEGTGKVEREPLPDVWRAGRISA